MSTSIELRRTTGLVSLGTHSFKVSPKSEEDQGDAGPYWRVIAEVISPGDDQGKEVMHSLSLSPKARFKMDEFLDGIGAPKKGSWTLEQSIGKTFRGSVGTDTYQGKPKSVINSIIPFDQLSKSFATMASEYEDSDEKLPLDVLLDEQPPTEAPTPKRRGEFD